MYLKHFGLREFPFSLTPNTRFFFNSIGFKSARNVLSVAIASGEGFIKITGEVGTGKTLLCRNLLNTLGDQYVTAYLPNPSFLTTDAIIRCIADELSLATTSQQTIHEIMRLLSQRLIDIASQGKQAILLIDEAQTLPPECLEGIRLLSNLETEECKLLQVVLFGQPELDERLATVEFRQLRQRIAFSYVLPAMDKNEMEHYINHRLMVAGYQGPPLFSAKVLDHIHQSSQGILRLVNILCHKCLMAAFGLGESNLTLLHVQRAIADTGLTTPKSWNINWKQWAMTLLSLVLLGSTAAVILLIQLTATVPFEIP